MRRSIIVTAVLGALTIPAGADEGMWPLNPPYVQTLRKQLQAKYRFDLDDAWLGRAMHASVRFNNGGSGSFVSPDGLVVTNHHIGADSLQKLSPPGKNYYRDGYYAKSPDQELRCPDLELNVLQSIEDVTDHVNAAVKPGMAPAEAVAARRAVIAQIEKDANKETGLRCDVVTLFQGGAYNLYRYKKYTDVRLVFAPEYDVASFGGDVDNFEYPRFDLDVCFFRVYEDGKPLRVKEYFPWSRTGPAEGDLVFVSGHPGATQRTETAARLRHRRDLTLPYLLSKFRFVEALLSQFAARGPDESRMAQGEQYSAANSRKAISGQYEGLLNARLLEDHEAREAKLRRRVETDPELKGKYGDAWARVAAAQKALEGFERPYMLLEFGDAFNSKLFRIARHLVRLAEEKPKANADRLPEYRDTALASLELQLFSPAPIHTELEREKLAGSFRFLAENLGGAASVVQRVLGGKSPGVRASELIAGTKLADPAERRRVAQGGLAEIEKSTDPLIQLACRVDPESRKLRKRFEEEVSEVEKQAYAAITEIRRKYGTSVSDVCPDATFTLRLAYGVVKGYKEDGRDVPFFTTFAGAFERAAKHGNREPFALPQRWLDRKGTLDLATPCNFVSTADTIGGNSGSPVLNRAGELVGINFDRNRHGLVRNFLYTDEMARHVAVHCRAVLEALETVYDAGLLAKELVRR
jgi:hypothetical protein